MRKFTETEWAALTAHATKLGTQHGTNAGEWATQNMSDDTARWWLKGIEDGDPEVLDTMPGAPLSGEFAGSYDMHALYRDLEVSMWDDTDDGELCTAYEDAHGAAVHAEIERRARHQLA